MKPAVRFENVSKKYVLGTGHSSLGALIKTPVRRLLRRPVPEPQVLWALKDASFDIEPGRALGLIGPNGSGKTTSLKLLSKITFPTSGRISVNGRISALIELGAGFHPDLTGRENVYLNATILGMKRHEIDARFDRIVEFSGLERFIDTPVKRYSSGMYVRLGFSVAAHVEPDILLVDEVLAVGDAQFRQKCARRIEELQKLGTTIVFVAHNLYLVKSVCDEAVFLLNGQIQDRGPVDDVISSYEKYLHELQARSLEEDKIDPLRGDRRRGVTTNLKITGINVVNEQGETPEQFYHNEPVEIRIHYQAKKKLERPNVILRIRRADGTTAAMIRTADYGLALDPLEGDGTISLKIDPIQLAGGAYLISASLQGPVDGVGLAWADSRWFQVSGVSVSFEESSGVFVPHVATVQVIPGNANAPGESVRVLRR
ncbi:MAG: ABC transporter ATP-binding protein [Candidatus Promineifilaceae bacterium]